MASHQGRPVTRDEAILALNDHLGQEVEVIVEREGPKAGLVMVANGPLRHWRAGDRGGLALGARDGLAGFYEVGGASINITELNVAYLLADGDEPAYGLGFELGPGVELTVVWGPETEAAPS
jgi:hypothetical protein